MNIPGLSPESNLPGYDFARLTGHSANDFDFSALGAAMDCNRDFAQAGIIYAEGANRYLVRPNKRHPNGQSGVVTHVIVTKSPVRETKSNAGKVLADAVSAKSLGPESVR